mgnify:CR=1
MANGKNKKYKSEVIYNDRRNQKTNYQSSCLQQD